MAAVQVTSTSTNNLDDGTRFTFRDNNGSPWVLVFDSNNIEIQLWRGNNATPTSFTEIDDENMWLCLCVVPK